MDPFCGTGTTMLAAMKADRNSIGIEIDPQYCADAMQRLEKYSNDLFNHRTLEMAQYHSFGGLKLVSDSGNKKWAKTGINVMNEITKTSEFKKTALKTLRQIPGVGEKIAGDMWELGISSAADLKGKDPEELYQRLCCLQGAKIDRCMLYVFRSAVYFASNSRHDPELLKWWNWKDK